MSMLGSNDAGKDLTIPIQYENRTLNLRTGGNVRIKQCRGSILGSLDFEYATINLRPCGHAGIQQHQQLAVQYGA